MPFLEIDAHCPICEKAAHISAETPDLRNTFICSVCNSRPRERVLMYVLQKYFPDWRNMDIHKSSGNWRGASLKMLRECKSYTLSHYDQEIGFGNIHERRRYISQDLTSQTFPRDYFDLVVTQDVFEHLMDPDKAIREIARTLKPGGAHVCTVPIVRKDKPSRRWAVMRGNEIVYLLPKEIHGNPVGGKGSLVTIDWGWDIAAYLSHHSGLTVTICDYDIVESGLRANFNEVLICRKNLFLSYDCLSVGCQVLSSTRDVLGPSSQLNSAPLALCCG